jgi:hypothetical protein
VSQDPWNLTEVQRRQFREAHAKEKERAMAGEDNAGPETHGRGRDRFADDITTRARLALKYNDGIPEPAWSTGERLVVALVLGRTDLINVMGYDRDEALERLAGDLYGSVADAEAWVEAVATRVRDAR